MDMDVQATKLELIQLLLETQKESLLKKLKDVFDKEEMGWDTSLSDEEIAEIEIGLSEADNDEVKANSSVMKKFEKWH